MKEFEYRNVNTQRQVPISSNYKGYELSGEFRIDSAPRASAPLRFDLVSEPWDK